MRDTILRQIPLKRSANRLSIASCVLYLVRDASYVTGQIITWMAAAARAGKRPRGSGGSEQGRISVAGDGQPDRSRPQLGHRIPGHGMAECRRELGQRTQHNAYFLMSSRGARIAGSGDPHHRKAGGPDPEVARRDGPRTRPASMQTLQFGNDGSGNLPLRKRSTQVQEIIAGKPDCRSVYARCPADQTASGAPRRARNIVSVGATLLPALT